MEPACLEKNMDKLLAALTTHGEKNQGSKRARTESTNENVVVAHSPTVTPAYL